MYNKCAGKIWIIHLSFFSTARCIFFPTDGMVAVLADVKLESEELEY